VTVALEGIENVLKAGEMEAQASSSTNPYTTFVDEAEGLDKLEHLQVRNEAVAHVARSSLTVSSPSQNHENEDVYKKAVHILETYFGLDEEDEQLAPEITSEGFVFQQSTQEHGMGGSYQFG